MTISDNAKEKNKDLANLIQDTFPGLDVWYVNSYTPDASSREAKIKIHANCGHFGIGSRGRGRTKVRMKVYNIESGNFKTFFFDKIRLEKEGINIEKSITYKFSRIECLKDFLEESTQQDIINKINQKFSSPESGLESENLILDISNSQETEQKNKVW